MPTFGQAIQNRKIIIRVGVAPGNRQERREYSGLLDTGATDTLISPNVVTDLALKPIGRTFIAVASGDEVPVNRCYAWIDIPVQYPSPHSSVPESFFWGEEQAVLSLPFQPSDYDVLLGMDLIGLFHITMFKNLFILSN